MAPAPRTGGLILCGGRSSRMGTDKARLRFGPRSLLDVALAHMAQVADEIVVSVADDAAPPPAAAPSVPVRWARDDAPYRGPLFGLLHGFRALAPGVQRIVVMPVDMPFLSPPWLGRLLDGLAGQRACAFRWEGYTNALTAAYAADLLPRLEQIVAEGKQRPLALLDGLAAPELEVERLWLPDDGPSPMQDADTPEDYRRVLLAGGFGTVPGVAVTVHIAAPPGVETPPPVPLLARTAGDVSRVLAQLWPELLAPRGGAVERGSGTGPRVPLGADAVLNEGDILHWLPYVTAGGVVAN